MLYISPWEAYLPFVELRLTSASGRNKSRSSIFYHRGSETGWKVLFFHIFTLSPWFQGCPPHDCFSSVRGVTMCTPPGPWCTIPADKHWPSIHFQTHKRWGSGVVRGNLPALNGWSLGQCASHHQLPPHTSQWALLTELCVCLWTWWSPTQECHTVVLEEHGPITVWGRILTPAHLGLSDHSFSTHSTVIVTKYHAVYWLILLKICCIQKGFQFL